MPRPASPLPYSNARRSVEAISLESDVFADTDFESVKEGGRFEPMVFVLLV